MDNPYLSYLCEIPNTSWVTEIISEKFDDAVDMFLTNTIIFGGATRDCLGGKDLIGNLDVLVSNEEYPSLISRFAQNPKWVLINDHPQNLFYEHSHKTAIPCLTTFRTLKNRTVQITSPPSLHDEDTFQTVINFAKRVDIVCCGTILTNTGKMFEVIPNAYEDCKNNVLQLNKMSNISNLKQLQLRIKKLTSRGWYNNIHMKEAISIVKKNQKQLKKNVLIPTIQTYNKEAIDYTICINPLKEYISDKKQCTRLLKRHEIKNIGNKFGVIQLLRLIIKERIATYVIIHIMKNGDIIFVSKNGYASSHIFERLSTYTHQKINNRKVLIE